MTPQEKKQVIKNHFSSLGKKGGAATTKKMTKEQLHARAVKGGIARHAKKKTGDNAPKASELFY